MSIEAARAFNRNWPVGTTVEIAIRDGTVHSGNLLTPAFVWADFALVEVEGWPGCYTVDVVRPKLPALPRPDDTLGCKD